MEEMNLKFIIAAYSISWLVILGYLARLMTKGSQARTDYNHMSREIPEGGSR
jgi:CcmD family protein